MVVKARAAMVRYAGATGADDPSRGVDRMRPVATIPTGQPSEEALFGALRAKYGK